MTDPDAPAMRAGPTDLTPLVSAPASGAPPPFPKAKVGLDACWQSDGLSGQYDSDFADLVKACGTPTGMVRFTQTMKGVLDQGHTSDLYKTKLYAGFCYRALAAGDSTMADLDIRLQKPDGALIAVDRATQPIAILADDKAWCEDADADINFVLFLDGKGSGRYAFQLWIGPKS